jgi:hypothetical protein
VLADLRKRSTMTSRSETSVRTADRDAIQYALAHRLRRQLGRLGLCLRRVESFFALEGVGS